MNISLNIEIFQEGDQYVSLAPELNISSFGNSVDNAKASLKEAIDLFLEETSYMGTLNTVLEECGFTKVNNHWEHRKAIAKENITLNLNA